MMETNLAKSGFRECLEMSSTNKIRRRQGVGDHGTLWKPNQSTPAGSAYAKRQNAAILIRKAPCAPERAVCRVSKGGNLRSEAKGGKVPAGA